MVERLVEDLIAKVAVADQCWAAVAPGDASPPFYIHGATCRRTQAAVREHLGQAWKNEGEDHKRGWRRARRAGWRVIRVEVVAYRTNSNARLLDGQLHDGMPA